MSAATEILDRVVERGGLGKWSEAGVPHRGWTCICVEDHEEPTHVCEMCEQTLCRYVHSMMHPQYPAVLHVGCVCAGRMEEDYEAAKRRETKVKQRVHQAKKENEIQSWIEAADEMFRRDLLPYERQFVSDMRERFVHAKFHRRKYQPSEKQENWFVSLYRKHVGAEVAAE